MGGLILITLRKMHLESHRGRGRHFHEDTHGLVILIPVKLLNRTTQVTVTFTTHPPTEHCPTASGGKHVGRIHNTSKEMDLMSFESLEEGCSVWEQKTRC